METRDITNGGWKSRRHVNPLMPEYEMPSARGNYMQKHGDIPFNKAKLPQVSNRIKETYEQFIDAVHPDINPNYQENRTE